jgi:hypothetical protein
MCRHCGKITPLFSSANREQDDSYSLLAAPSPGGFAGDGRDRVNCLEESMRIGWFEKIRYICNPLIYKKNETRQYPDC